VLDRCEDPVTLLGDRSGEFDERRQPAATRPHQPPVQQPLSGRRRELVDLSELLFEQVGAVEPGVGLLDRGELRGLAIGEVLGVLPDSEPGALELARALQVPLAAGRVPHHAADVVQRFGIGADRVGTLPAGAAILAELRRQNCVFLTFSALRASLDASDRANVPATWTAEEFEMATHTSPPSSTSAAGVPLRLIALCGQ